MTKTRIVLVGEAFGEREEMFHHAFVGPSGRELARMLAEAELTPSIDIKYPSELEMIRYWSKLRNDHQIALENVFNARPPGNQIEFFFGGSKEDVCRDLPPLKPGKFLKTEHRHYVERLWQSLAELAPNLVVAFGNSASWATLGQTKISALRGTVQISDRLKLKVIPTYHPAAVLRQWTMRTIVIADLKKALVESESREIHRPKRWLLLRPTIKEIHEWFAKPAQIYSVDIETFYDQISMIGFARSPQDTINIPFIDPNKPSYSYWTTEGEETQAWCAIRDALESPVPKLFQNGMFDLQHLTRAGMRTRNALEDTMILSHSIYPEMLKGLGFLGSIYSREGAWKSAVKHSKKAIVKRDE